MRLCGLLTIVLVGCASSAPRETPTALDEPPAYDVSAVSGLGLFHDEGQQSREQVAAELRGRGLPVTDLAKVDAAVALAAEGRHPLTGQQCGMALSRAQFLRRWGPAFGVGGSVSSSVWCDEGQPCLLSLHGSSEGGVLPKVALEAEIDANQPPLRALTAALPKLSAPRPSSGGLGMLGAAASSAPRLEDTVEVRATPADPRQRAVTVEGPASSVEPARLAACFGGEHTWQALLVEADASGKLTRCEPRDEGAGPGPCLCGHFLAMTPNASLASRRWSFAVQLTRKDRLTRDGRLVVSAFWNTHTQQVKAKPGSPPRSEERVEDPSLRGWAPGSGRLVAGCFEGRTEAGQLHSRWAVWFDAAGHVTKVAEQKGWPPLDADTAACVSRLLRTAAAPCPARGGLWAMADLHVTLRDPSPPLPRERAGGEG